MKKLFTVRNCYNLLWPEVKTFLNTKRGYSWPETTRGQNILKLTESLFMARNSTETKSHREAIYGKRLPYFIMAKGQNILKITERLFVA